jgi:protoporphyrinogen oxidase
MTDLVLLGGGVTGLATAYLAALAGRSVTIIEKSNDLGGLLATFDTPGGDPLEYYYHHFFTHDVEILWLLRSLGLEKDLFFKETSMGFFSRGKIYNFSTPKDLLFFSPLSLLGKARFAATSLYLSKAKSWRQFESISALSWFYKYAGKEVTDTIWRPMLEIKFGSHASSVPLAWMIGRLQQRMASRKGTTEQLGYLLGSSRKLVEALKNALVKLGVIIITSEEVTSLLVTNDTAYGLRLKNGKEIKGEQIVSTIPTPHLIPLLPDNYSVFKEKLNQVKYFGAICGIVFSKKPLSPIYWLNISEKGFPFGGIIEQTNFIDAHRYGNQHIAYLSRYVELDNPLIKVPSVILAKEWRSFLTKIFPSFNLDDIIDIKFFRTTTAAPICDTNFSQIVPPVRTDIKNFSLVSMAHVYPDERSVNNSIRVAANLCSLLNIKHSVPEGRSLAGTIGF